MHLTIYTFVTIALVFIAYVVIEYQSKSWAKEPEQVDVEEKATPVKKKPGRPKKSTKK